MFEYKTNIDSLPNPNIEAFTRSPDKLNRNKLIPVEKNLDSRQKFSYVVV